MTKLPPVGVRAQEPSSTWILSSFPFDSFYSFVRKLCFNWKPNVILLQRHISTSHQATLEVQWTSRVTEREQDLLTAWQSQPYWLSPVLRPSLFFLFPSPYAGKVCKGHHWMLENRRINLCFNECWHGISIRLYISSDGIIHCEIFGTAFVREGAKKGEVFMDDDNSWQTNTNLFGDLSRVMAAIRSILSKMWLAGRYIAYINTDS